MPAGYVAGGPPPAYERVIRRVYPYSLRFVVMCSALIGLLWGLAMGVQNIRYRSSDGETSKEKLFDTITLILYFAVAAVELVVMYIAFMDKLSVGRLLPALAPTGVALVVAAQIMQVVEHFVAKTDLLNQCISNYTNGTITDFYGDTETIDSADATSGAPSPSGKVLTSACNSSWSHDTVTDVAWLIVGTIIALTSKVLFAFMAVGYYRQLVDPASVRRRLAPTTEQAIPLQPQGYGQQQQPWIVPPYPGPPGAGGQYANYPPPPGGVAPAPGFEKGDYVPDAEWAQAGYAPPPGPPPGHGGAANPFSGGAAGARGPGAYGGEHGSNAAEDEAWERARSEGVTAHLTGHGPAPATRSEDRGYVIGNPEEDEAWERARHEGVTAHLTGGGLGARRTETDV